jgi:hypothetical protein
MATPYVHNMPQKLYRLIRKLAKQEGLSVSADVIQPLGQGLRAREPDDQARTVAN